MLADTVCSENCRRQNALGLEDSDTIALTANLVAYWKNEEVHAGQRLRSLEPNDVLPFLRYNLHWRILDVSISSQIQLFDADLPTKSRGRQHDPQSIESLRVSVGSQEVRMPSEHGGRPEYGLERIWPDVATGV